MEVLHGEACIRIKGEDVTVVHHVDASLQYPAESTLFLICDGHGGRQAASFVADRFPSLLCSKLPTPYPASEQGMPGFALAVREAMYKAFIDVDNCWLEVGLSAGTTITAALLLGPLLTVANIGDSFAMLAYDGAHALDLTTTHRLEDSPEERDRMQRAGCKLAAVRSAGPGPAGPEEEGVGPLRVWPGGLCMSRSVGDAECGRNVVPIPHLKQVLLDAERCDVRLVLASDGLWDVVPRARVLRMLNIRPGTPATAARDLARAAVTDHSAFDDTSVLVVDVHTRPHARTRPSPLHRAADKGAPSSPTSPAPRQSSSATKWLGCLGIGSGTEHSDVERCLPPAVATPRQSNPLVASGANGRSSGQRVEVLADEDGMQVTGLEGLLARRALLGAGGAREEGRPPAAAALAGLVAEWNQQQRQLRSDQVPDPARAAAAAALRQLGSVGLALDSRSPDGAGGSTISNSNSNPNPSTTAGPNMWENMLRQHSPHLPAASFLLTAASAEPACA